MAKRKQSLPRRAKGTPSKPADALEATGDAVTSYTNPDSTAPRTTLHTKYASGGVVLYSPGKVSETIIDFAEVSLQAVLYQSSSLGVTVKEVIHKEPLSVRLNLSDLERDSVVGLRSLSVEEVKVEVFQHDCVSQEGLSLDAETQSNANVLLSGYLDCTDETVSAFAYLFKTGYINVKPQLQIDENENPSNVDPFCSLRIGVTQKSFDASSGLLDGAKSLCSRSMLKVMKWLRPDLHTDESIYGSSHDRPSSTSSSLLFEMVGQETEGRSQQAFDPSLLYEALRPDQSMPVLDQAPPKLRAKLRPYQSRAAHWMVMRERSLISSEQNKSQLAYRSMSWPFCLEVLSLDEKTGFYYNPFSGAVSKIPLKLFPDVRGGILADEMGLGKTVELLACIMTNSDKADHSEVAERASKELDSKLSRRRRERIACPCGTYDDDDHSGVWVQCDICDVWQHASCVGFGMEYESIELFEKEMAARKRQVKLSQKLTMKNRKITSEKALTVREKRYTVNRDYICGVCAKLIGSVEVEGVSGATLIVCPSSILGQWQEEIARHTEKGALKVIVYEGFQRGPGLQSEGEVSGSRYGKIVGAHELAMADIVLTTYNTLQADLSHDTHGDDSQVRSMRYVKRYPIVPTPLTRMTWRRVCLDEAQMVENSSARATEMAKRLNAEIRWCITGTPIQRSLDDLHGLLSFLDLQPFCDSFWWTRVLKEPYERNGTGAVNFLHNYLKAFMWRSSKAHVSHELGLPPQEDQLTWLTFSPVEAHFYHRQHERCAKKALEVMSGNFQTSKPFDDRMLTPAEVAKIMHPLLSLRQACCHPQVGSSGLRSLQKLPMTMDEVLKVLIDKAKTEGEEAQRSLVGALNGLAALKILEDDFPAAVNLYREALSVIEENAEVFDVDPLQKLHLLHNLQETLIMAREIVSSVKHSSEGHLSRKRPRDEADGLSTSEKLQKSDGGDLKGRNGGIMEDHALSSAEQESCYVPGVSRTLRDDLLGQQCQEISAKYMASFYAKLSAAQQDYSNAHSEVCDRLKDLEVIEGETWWLDILASIDKESKQAKDLVKKIKNALLERDALALSKRGHENASSLALRFHDLNGLQYILNRELDAIFDCRKKLLEKISEVDELMKNPSAEHIERAGNCSQCDHTQKGPMCAICEADQVYQMYENRLFMLKSSAASVGEVVSLEDAFAAQQRLLSQKRMNTLKMAAGSCGVLLENSGEGTSQAIDIANIQVSRLPSETENILKLIKTIMKQKMDLDGRVASSKHLELLEAMRKEYSQARLLAVSQRMVLLALDELNMAKTRLCLTFSGDKDSKTSGDAFKIHPEEIPQRNAQLSGEKYVALDDLRRAKGQVRYLEGLATTRERSRRAQCSVTTQSSNVEASLQENAENLNKKAGTAGGITEENCPVCQEHLGTQMMVFPCGHLLCCKCLMTIAESDDQIGSQTERKRIACPSCRYRSPMDNIAFIDNGVGETPYSKSVNRLHSQNSHEEASIDVDGSYGTKMEAVVRRILWVQASDPNSKFLVFSTWNDVLDVVEHSLAANKVDFLRAKGRRHLNTAIRKFKAKDEAAKVLLLLIQQGANGLNLTEAQHVILVEPLLNPGAEAQAVNRIHRIGQEHATFVHRFLIKDTVEESIYKLSQQKMHSSKRRISMGRRSNQDVADLTVKDLKMLFKGEAESSIPRIQTGAAEDKGQTLNIVNLRELPPSVAAAAAAEARLLQAQNASRLSEA